MTYDYSPLGSEADVAGDPLEVLGLAHRYLDTVAEIDKAASGLKKIKDTNDNWEGEAGPHFRDKSGDLADRITKTRARYEAAGEALQTYSGELDSAQWSAAQAAAAARTAQSTMDANAPGPDLPADATDAQKADAHTASIRYGAAQTDYATAQKNWKTAVSAYHAAAKKASDAIKDAIDHDGLKDSWWYRHFEMLKKILEVIAIVIAVVAVVCLVLSCPWLLAMLPMVGGALTAAMAAGGALATVVGVLSTAAIVAGAVTAALTLGLDIYGKSAGMDISAKDIALDVLGVALSLAAFKIPGLAKAATEGANAAATAREGASAADQVLSNASVYDDLGDVLLRMQQARDIGETAVKEAAEHAVPTIRDVLQGGLEGAGDYAELRTLAQFDPAAVRSALTTLNSTTGVVHGVETGLKFHEYQERIDTLRELVGLGPSDPTPAISGQVKQHVMATR